MNQTPSQSFADYSTPDTIFSLLDRIPLFTHVEDEVKRMFAATCRPRIRPANQELVCREDEPNHAYIIISGLVQVEKPSAEETKTFFAYRGPTQNVGINNLVLNENHKYTSRTLTRCCFFEIRRDNFTECYDVSKRLNRNILSYYIDRLYSEVEHRESMMRLTKPGRVTNTFLQIAEATRVKLVSDDADSWRLGWLRQEMLEKQLCISHPIVSDSYKHLRGYNAIEGGSGVHDPVRILSEKALHSAQQRQYDAD